MTLAERIAAVREHAHMNVSEFSRNVGFKTPQTIRELENGRTKNLSFEAATKILTAYPEINKDWLETGEGCMLRPLQQHAEEIEVENSDNIGINLNNSKMSSTKNEGLANSNYMEIIKDYQRQIQELTERIKEKDARIAQLTDKLLGL